MSLLSLKSGLLLSMAAFGLMTTSWQLLADPIRRLPQAVASPISQQITIKQAIAIALRDNQQLRALHMEQVAAEHDSKAAETQRLPNLDLETGFTLLSDAPSLNLGSRLGSIYSRIDIPQAEEESISARSRFSLPIYTGGAISKSIQAANSQQVRIGWRHENAKSQLKIKVIESYLNLLLAQETERVSVQLATNRKLHWNEIRNQHKNGVATKGTLLAEKAAVLESQQKVRTAQMRRQTAAADLNRLLSRPPNASLQASEITDPDVPSADLATLIDISMRNRPELPELRAEQESLRWNAKSIDAERLPQVGLFGEFAFQENRFVSPEGIGSLAVAATWNAFDGGRKYHQSESLHRKADSLHKLMLDYMHEIERQVFVAWNQLRDLESQLRTKRERLSASMESMRVADRRFLQGVGSRNETLDAEFDSVQRSFDLHQLQIEITRSKFQLRYILGVL